MKKILVANRGEIALRIMRTLKEMHLETVAVFSEPDRKMPFVRYADESVCIGPAKASESYLNIAKIIQVCKDLNVDAVHPGYGFLSENADFARELEKAGVILIGPSAESIEVMGDKLKAKEAVSAYNIPLIPGSKGEMKDVEEALKLAEEIGYPVMIKAAAGGGGKGMRVAKHKGELKEMFEMAVSEATKSFGNGAVFLEKYILSPRHIEVQVLADTKGNIVHLFERECTIQRRHQKVIEEAPSAFLTEQVRNEIGASAINVAKSCGYVGAGTVEFVMDVDKKFYFLEMNTRLQVEHPVTEMITGIDLVKEQVRIARGEALGYSQDDIQLSGHSIEIRVNAEDSSNDFLPDSGVLKLYKTPSGRGVRVDDGYEQGLEVSTHYDPMIAKLIVHGANRSEAILKARRAIEDFRISGIETTLDFCDFVLSHDDFVTCDFDTGFIEKNFHPDLLVHYNEDEAEIAAIVAGLFFDRSNQKVMPTSNATKEAISKWKLNR